MKKFLKNVCFSLIFFAVFLSVFLICVKKDSNAVYVPSCPESNISFPDQNDKIKYLKSSFTVTGFTESASKGDTAFVEVRSADHTEISITSFYSSGKSSSSAFIPKYPDESGYVRWEWKIPVNTTTDKIRIVLRSKTGYAELFIKVDN